ncbi:MAG: hypothetical protein DMG39_22730 [Acidobacteria bacterium]|nr:MAG: hypothetical protein DMG39_22730 [Acidobacteriota bacterium]
MIARKKELARSAIEFSPKSMQKADSSLPPACRQDGNDTGGGCFGKLFVCLTKRKGGTLKTCRLKP